MQGCRVIVRSPVGRTGSRSKKSIPTLYTVGVHPRQMEILHQIKHVAGHALSQESPREWTDALGIIHGLATGTTESLTKEQKEKYLPDEKADIWTAQRDPRKEVQRLGETEIGTNAYAVRIRHLDTGELEQVSKLTFLQTYEKRSN